MRFQSFVISAVLGCGTILGSMVWTPSTATAQGYRTPDLMPDVMIKALGLEQAWTKTVSTPFGRQSLIDVQIFADPASMIQYTELVQNETDETATPKSPATQAMPTQPKILLRLRMGQMSDEGRLIDPSEAKRIVDNEMRRYKRRGIETSSRTVSVPNVLLYSLANDGTLERRDAETGELHWRVVVGRQRLGYGTLGVGANDVIVTNGGNLIQVRATDGFAIQDIPSGRPPRFGATVSGDFALLHTIGGNIEAYPLRDVTIDPYLEHVQGSALTNPVRVPSSSRVGWTTDQGYVYVMEVDGTPSTLFRLKTNGMVPGGLAAADNDRYYFGSDAGQAYGLRSTMNGRVMWVESIGEPFQTAPLMADDRVLFVTAYGNLFCLDAQTGKRLWEGTTQISQTYAAFGGRLYARTNVGKWIVIDLKDGTTVESPGQFEPDMILPNLLTNRLYVVNTSGLIQCLKPMDSDLPKLITSIEGESAPAASDAMPKDSEIAADKKEVDSSKTEADPFGASEGGGEGGADPFGATDAGSDPFGAADTSDDPFGGMTEEETSSDDPFN
jgi:outer membrane protein assembly factor BamB